MNNKIIVFLLPLFFLSCEEEIADEFDCVTLSAELTTGLEAYSSNPADTVSCLSLKAQAADFINNSCDTTGIGDLSFLADSLDCGMMACATPVANLIAYGIAQTFLVDPDSLTYCAYFDSSVVAMEAIVAVGGCEQEGFPAITQEMVDSVKAAGCDWTAPLATQIIGQWGTVKQCVNADGENCTGEMDCIDFEPGLNQGDLSLNIFEDGNMIATGAQCECEDENQIDIEDCDWNEADGAQNPTECDALGGFWAVWVDTLGTMVWSDSDPHQFQVTIDESDCECEDENGNTIEDCDWDEADNAQNQTACEAVGGVWYPEFMALDFSLSAAADTLSFDYQEYDDAECSCEDENGDSLEDCDWDAADNAQNQTACEAVGGIWEDAEWECVTVYNIRF